MSVSIDGKRIERDNDDEKSDPKKKPIKKIRKTKTEQIHTNSDLNSILGNVYTISHSYRQPDVVQVVGWTKNSAKPDAKIRFIYVRRVKFISNDHMHGGDGVIDKNDVLVVLKPQHTGDERLTLQSYTEIGGQKEFCLQKREQNYVTQLYLERDLDRRYMWCDY